VSLLAAALVLWTALYLTIEPASAYEPEAIAIVSPVTR
jgi:hypothetical protein